jgi:L-lactate dehydrogenase complex protein LldE
MIVDIFIPCFIDQIYPETGSNMVKVLEKLGCGVNYNIEQTCCGQPAFTAGHWDAAKEVGEKFIHDFSSNRYIVCPSASCVGMVKNDYPKLFHNTVLHNEYKQIQKNIFEFSDFIVNILKVTDVGATFNGVVTYHDSCQALRECRIKTEPRALLANVKGLTVIEMNEVETCCGFGGVFSIKHENIASAMAGQKIENALETKAEYIVSTDSSCLMHLDGFAKQNKTALKMLHIADVLASGY